MTPYYQLLPIEVKPEKDGWYRVANGDKISWIDYEYKNGKWDCPLGNDFTHYLSPVSGRIIGEDELEKVYEKWCKETKRNGSVLVGGSIKEFFDYFINQSK